MQQGSTARWSVVGIDLSDKESTYVVLNRRGEVLHEGKVRTTSAALASEFSRSHCRVAIETGSHSPWVSRLLSALGHEVIVANPRQVQLIAKSNRKSDRVDAQTLARLARLDPGLLRPIKHRSREVQAHLSLLRSRDELVALRTGAINHVRGAVKSVGERLPACSAPSFHKKVAGSIPEALRPGLEPVLTIISELTRQIQELDKQVLALIEAHYPAARGLMAQLNGVGPLTALAFVLTIEDPGRFAKSREVGPYLGLTRRRRDSGESEPALHITKAGDPFLRRLLVQCAHYILGPFGQDCDLRRWGLGLEVRLGQKRAIVAVARKLGVLMHRLWSTGEVYHPLRAEQLAAA
jgi:transposase